MSKYQVVNAAIEQAVASGAEQNLGREEILLALIVAGIAAYRAEAGREATRDALRYELGEVEGATDTQFIRSR